MTTLIAASPPFLLSSHFLFNYSFFNVVAALKLRHRNRLASFCNVVETPFCFIYRLTSAFRLRPFFPCHAPHAAQTLRHRWAETPQALCALDGSVVSRPLTGPSPLSKPRLRGLRDGAAPFGLAAVVDATSLLKHLIVGRNFLIPMPSACRIQSVISLFRCL